MTVEVNTQRRLNANSDSAAMTLLKSGFRRARVPLNSLAAKTYRQNSLPEELFPAIEYLLTDRHPAGCGAVADRIEELRDQLAQKGAMKVGEYVAGARPDAPDIEQRALVDIAHFVSVPRSFGIFLYLCSEGFKARRILELGACAGISGCYLASGSHCKDFVTLELSGALAAIATENLRHVIPDPKVINASFDEGLGEVIGEATEPFDIIWIDGHHESDATLRYFKRLKDHAAPGKLMLFDDINWPEMQEAWALIRRWPGFSHTINATRFGIGVVKAAPDKASPENWRLDQRLKFTRLVRE
jgi:predicted O-methyltransferase YrrM